MHATMTVKEPGEIEVTASITMRLKDWEKLRDQLASAYPAWRLSDVISKMMADATQTLYASSESKED